MYRRPPGSTRTDTLFPYTTLFRSEFVWLKSGRPHRRVWWTTEGGDMKAALAKLKFSLLSGVGVIACSSLVDAASAQVPAGKAITSAAVPIHDPTGDIVVTARRTAERLQAVPLSVTRSEERRVGHECVRPCRSRGPPYHKKK